MKDDIGKTVYISNSVAACQEWRIADINHDDTTGTVDLFPKYLLEDTVRPFSDGTIYYKNSNLRTWLNTTFYDGFTEEVKNAIKTQSFPSNYETLNDKVKCPSITEIGSRDSLYEACTIEEGTIYPIFGNQQSRPNDLALYKHTNGNSNNYWTRSRCIGNDNFIINASKNCNKSNPYYVSSAVVACIRF